MIIKRVISYAKGKAKNVIRRNTVKRITARLVVEDNLTDEYEGRILFDMTLSHAWLREGIMVGIVRECNELFIAFKKKMPTEMVQVRMLDGKPELHKIDVKTLFPTDEIILPKEGDIFITPELQIRGVHVPMNFPAIGYMKKYGVKCFAIINDILPTKYPDLFEKDTTEGMPSYVVNILRNYDSILCISKTVCDTVIDYCSNNTLPCVNVELSCGISGNPTRYLTNGWHSPENDFIWSTDRSILTFYTCDLKSDIRLRMSYHSLKSVGNTKVFINKYEIGMLFESDESNEVEITIPSVYLNGNGIQNILFLTENATSPAELGINGDSRKLGIAAEYIKLSSEQESEEKIISVVNKPINVYYYHLGATELKRIKGRRISKRIKEFANLAGKENMFLMVGTIEPRKGHEYILEAFEKLWEQGETCYLCIIGRVGWNMEEFLDKMKKNKNFEKKFIFLEAASDATLAYAYNHSAALIQASIDEGFGLPLIEAGQYKVPIICSDIDIFHEVAQENAVYFDRSCIEGFVDGYYRFRKLQKENNIPDSAKIEYLTWEQSAKSAFDVLTGKCQSYGILEAKEEKKDE